MYHIGDRLRRDSSGVRGRKIFAIVAPPMPSELGRKRVQRVLIFDNHPDSLRLVSQQRLNPDVDCATRPVRPADELVAPGHMRTSQVVLGLGLIVTLVLAMLWPLLTR